MNKYKTKILSEDGRFRGYVLLNEEVVFDSGLCKDTFAASRAINTFIGQQKIPKIIPPQPSQQSNAVPMPTTKAVVPPRPSNSSAQPRRCCGRG
jgi:hypothetical protein